MRLDTLLWAAVFLLGAVCAVGAIFLTLRRTVSRFRYQLRARQVDRTQLAILFQTVRDILEQQKVLSQRVRDASRRFPELVKTVETLRQEVEALRAERLTPPPAPETFAPESEGSATAQLDLPYGYIPESERWVGLDLVGDAPDPHAFDVPEAPPVEPGDAEATRDAFRTLLDLQSEPVPAAAPVAPRPAPAAAQAGGNGQTKLTPLQARVYQYCDAGMSIPQIAQELGIGKGEVRLILSLRKDKGH